MHSWILRVAVPVAAVSIFVLAGFIVTTQQSTAGIPSSAIITSANEGCVECHGGDNAVSPALFNHWGDSRHAGVGVGCVECHSVPAAGTGPDIENPRYVVNVSWNKKTGLRTEALATKDGMPLERPDIWNHGGIEIVTNVTHRKCIACHKDSVNEFTGSRHASASNFVGSIDNFLGRFVEGPAAANNGCQQCHGSNVRVVSNSGTEVQYAPDTWPNTGIGRVNADGSWGSCSACHSRHSFASETARRPENCGKCHMGPDHPQIEIYNESKHGIRYQSVKNEMNIEKSGDWVLGEDYYQAPTCSTCHMGAVAPYAGAPEGIEATHEVGARISWTLRPPVSGKPGPIVEADGTVVLKDAEGRRDDMKIVCGNCHSSQWVNNFYTQFDQAVELYNNKYGKPLVAIYKFLKAEEIVDAVPMNEEMDFLYFEIWHHEGRRARHGAAMMGPDYTQWHGFYELSKHFYTEFLPLAQELGEHAGKGDETAAFIDEVLHRDNDWELYHRWQEGLTPEQKATMLTWEQDEYEK